MTILNPFPCQCTTCKNVFTNFINYYNHIIEGDETTNKCLNFSVKNNQNNKRPFRINFTNINSVQTIVTIINVIEQTKEKFLIEKV